MRKVSREGWRNNVATVWSPRESLGKACEFFLGACVRGCVWSFSLCEARGRRRALRRGGGANSQGRPWPDARPGGWVRGEAPGHGEARRARRVRGPGPWLLRVRPLRWCLRRAGPSGQAIHVYVYGDQPRVINIWIGCNALLASAYFIFSMEVLNILDYKCKSDAFFCGE